MRMFCAVLTNGVQARINPSKVAYVTQLADKSVIHFGCDDGVEVFDTMESIENQIFDCLWRDKEESK